MKVMRSKGAYLAVAALLTSACGEITAPTEASLNATPAENRGRGNEGAGDPIECRNMVLTGNLPSVHIPRGFSCFIQYARVDGNIHADHPESVEIRRTTVNGNIQIAGGGGPSNYINIWDHTTVTRGNVHVHGRSGGAIALFQVVVADGNVMLQQNDITHSLWVGHSWVTRNLHVSQNTIPSNALLLIERTGAEQNLQVIQNHGNGAKRVQFNWVYKNLLCFQNEAPFSGESNFAHRAHGQCGTIAPPF